MKTIKKTYNMQIGQSERPYIDNETVFLDIETTGFSRQTCNIYMIGLASLAKATDAETVPIEVTLLFAETPEEEPKILQEMCNYIQNTKRFITFNGLSFDFPFIQSRCNLYNIPFNLLSYNHIDIYKACKWLKEPLQLSNTKQKTFEKVLSIERDDIFDGGQLIEQYKTYAKSKDQACYNNLVTHNLEDVKGMVELLPILRYNNIYNSIKDPSVSSDNWCITELEDTLRCDIKLNIDLPKRMIIKAEYNYIVCENNYIKFILSPLRTKLKLFLPNNKDYMYLPKEDMIIPKQLINSQNKKEAVPARKDKCYIEKEGTYVPILDKDLFEGEKIYQQEYRSKNKFIDISSHMEDKRYMQKYILHIIKERLK